ncbi:MAG: endolytic transglycosylase MltG [Muribaculaceae bacterium]|nr:endolytic transglycosylase MltG [Muribaculaceae bacterium]MBR5639355.1 endolytic transglycosylase MltG [Muribaculaceae bacterium]
MAEIKKKTASSRARTSNRKSSKRPTWVKWLVGVAAALVVLAAVAAIVIVPTATSKYHSKDKDNKDAMIFIRQGSTLEDVRDSLAKATDKEFADNVVKLLKYTGTDLSKRQGAFIIKNDESAYSVARHLRSGAANEVKVTINNLRTKEDLAARLSKTLMRPKEEFLAALNNAEICQSVGMTTDNITGLFLADTYQFLWDVEPAKLIKHMKRNSDNFWNSERKSKAEKLGLTPNEVVALAAIVEGEIMKNDEKGMVARLYMNRLKQNMKLQADPTVKFALQKFDLIQITYDQLAVKSPWNTYYVEGLPPGPICMPEKSTIDAVLNAPEHNYIYMCAKDDLSGYHNFAETYAQHEANAAKYHKALREYKQKKNIK